MAVDYKSKKNVEISEILKSEHIFADVKKGELASNDKMKELFGTHDVLKVTKILLDEGEIQFTQEYRNKLQEEKRRKIITLIHQKGIDPRTNLPHPQTRIENAFIEAKIKVDYFKRAEEQVEEIIKKLRPILPIKFETKKIKISVGPNFGAKTYGTFQNIGKIIEQNWRNDGGLDLIVEIPAGLQEEVFDKLNSITHGQNETTILKD
jgi:ribosome maturation protein SDO1